MVKQKVLPGTRAKLILPLQEANTLLKSVIEVIERSGMGKKLGFMKTSRGMQPITDLDNEEAPSSDSADV